MKRVLSLILTLAMVIGIMPQIALTAGAVEQAGTNTNPYAGKTVSILSHSASTYTGVSNDATSNSTIGGNDIYYTEGRHDVYREDTWWQQTIDALGMELLVNNSWSGSCVFMPRKGEASVGYGNRAVNLHNDRTGEEPDVIFVYLGCNDFAYYKDTFGKEADVDYAQLISDNGDGTFTYAEPTTTCEAYAIMLHKATTRYPDAEIFCMTSTARRETDYTGDTYPDAGQPTEYSSQLQKVAAHFGFPVIDLEQAIPKEVAVFDQYMGDKRAHPNALGMDQITNAVLSVMLDKNAEIRHVLSEDGTVAEQAVLLGGSYHAEVEPAEGYAVVVTMDGADITAEAYSDGKISIDTVTGDISIHTVIRRDPLNFRWEVQNNALVSVGDADNSPSKLAGSIEAGVLINTRYQLSTSVVLKHNLPWEVEWKCSGDWRGSLFTSDPVQNTLGMLYLSRTVGGQLCFGTWTGKQYDNYGIDLSSLDSGTHTYRLVNRIAADGSNMVWAYVDGVEIGPMNHYYIGSKDQSKTFDWISGKDFVFPYISMEGHALRDCKLDYLQVQECGHSYQNGVCAACGAEDPNAAIPLPLRYDDRYDVTGKTVEIIDAGNSVVALEGNYLIATGIGKSTIRMDGKLYRVVVEKAKINIVTIMGQSNAGNHFANATSDITCPIGTAYWWGNGEGINATEPVDYTLPSMGFHTPLLAELYAQSVAAGNPVKNVLIWQEGITSKNGQSITKWAATENDTSGTDATAAMIKNCVAYYEQHNDKYEIVGTGVYWLQGESDVSMAPEKYTALFMAMWHDLKEAGAEYLAFLRVRKGVSLNGEDHEDLSYTGSLTAQLEMVNHNSDMFMATTITENWVGSANTKQAVDIRKYLTLMEEYGEQEDYTDSYGNAATIRNGILTATMKELYGSNNKCHYGKFGYGIIGADAAYNMYHALYKNDFSIVKADTSGKVATQLISNPGDTVTLDITDLEENLAFRASPGSAAGTLDITVKSGTKDITEQVIATGTNAFGTVDTKLLREHSSPVIIVTYTPVHGLAGSVTYQITDNSPEQSNVYHWDFEENLCARNENGEIVNAFGSSALNGSYILENGMLKATNLQLAITHPIQLCGTENWSVEWKLGKVSDKTTGFLLCNTENSLVGTKTIYMTTTGKTSISDYADTKGYRNFYTNDTAFASGDVLEITNRYDSDKGRSVLSLWINGKLAVADYQYKGAINKANDTLVDMSEYPLSGDFIFNYLGCKGISTFSVTCEIDYIKITTCTDAAGPVITLQPTDVETALGENYCVTVKAEGEGLKYQWYFRNAGSDTWYKSSVRDNTYDDVMTTARAGRQVYCVITDANGNSVTTDTVTLIRVPTEQLEILTQPTNGEAYLGDTYSVSVVAKGEGLKYQWYFRNPGSTGFTASSVRTDTYSDVLIKARVDREVYCVITDAFGNKVTTDTVKLVRLYRELTITAQPVSVEAALGENYCVSVEATGEELKYQWYFKNAGSDVWYTSGVRDNTYDDVMTTARAGREVYCVITDALGNTVTTDTVKLIRVASVELEITVQPTDVTAALGENYCVAVEAVGEGLKYQWYFRNKGTSTWYTSGVRDNTYDDVMTKSRAGREVYCVITDALGNRVTTETVTLNTP